jgi:hypothetical protein
MLKQPEFHSASWCGPRFDPSTLHHAVPANRRGFPDEKNARNPGRLARRIRSANRIPAVLPHSAPQFACQSLPTKFGFPGCTMEALGSKQRKPNIASASCRRQHGSAEFGPNLNRLSQSHCVPLLGPEHWQLGQALDAEPARKATLHRGFRQYRGDERERHRHPNRALALVFAHGERLDGLGRVDKKFVEPAASVAQRPDETVSRF